MLSYPAALPLSRQTLTYTAGIIRRHRTRIGSPWRKPGAGQQALLVLAYLRKGETFAEPARTSRTPADRRDGHRPGIVGIVLIDVPRGQQPDPCAQLGRRIQHPLTRREQRLSQQMPQAPAPSTVQVRCGHAAAQASSRPA